MKKVLHKLIIEVPNDSRCNDYEVCHYFESRGMGRDYCGMGLGEIIHMGEGIYRKAEKCLELK